MGSTRPIVVGSLQLRPMIRNVTAAYRRAYHPPCSNSWWIWHSALSSARILISEITIDRLRLLFPRVCCLHMRDVPLSRDWTRFLLFSDLHSIPSPSFFSLYSSVYPKSSIWVKKVSAMQRKCHWTSQHQSKSACTYVESFCSLQGYSNTCLFFLEPLAPRKPLVRHYQTWRSRQDRVCRLDWWSNRQQ